MVVKAPLAVLVGIAVAIGVMVAPSAAATDPTPGRAVQWGNTWVPSSTVPVLVDTSGVLAGKTLTTITFESAVTCGVADGRAYCWGSPYAGRLGNNTYTENLLAPLSPPVPVDTSGALAGKTVTALSAGTFHVCAVADGKAFCWGSNRTGQLGRGSDLGSAVPVAVDTSGVLAGKTVTAISAGGFHTCAVADGKAYCWGNNSQGELGNNAPSDTPSTVPVAVGGLLADKTVTAIAVNDYFSCAVADARAYCWGRDTSGNLGFDEPLGSPVPGAVDTSGVLSGKTVTAISAGTQHACAVADAKAYCWGGNRFGQLGNNTSDTVFPRVGPPGWVPVPVDTSGPLAGKRVTDIDLGSDSSCAIADGRVYCWGANAVGELGNGSTAESWVPVSVDTTGVLAGGDRKQHIRRWIWRGGAGRVCAAAAYGRGCCAGHRRGDGVLGRASRQRRRSSAGIRCHCRSWRSHVHHCRHILHSVRVE